MKSPLHVTYHVRSDARSIEQRARVVAVEQSVEMPLAAIDDGFVLGEIVGEVTAIKEIADRLFEVRIGLSAATIGGDAGQLLNMLFGNTSLHDDVVLHDVEFPSELTQAFSGPNHGLGELRRRAGAGARALTCSALKPQGLPPEQLADLAARFAAGGIDYVKDDHGLADQTYSPFAARVPAITQALRKAAAAGTPATRYIPSLSGDLDAMRAQIAIAKDNGIDAVMVAPMVMGPANFHRLAHDNPRLAFFAHPALSGSRISPPLLFGKIFRMLGADAVIFPNHGGRFGYTPDTCRALARAALDEWHGWRPAVPVPAGGMTRERVPEMLDFYGADIMLLIGGALLEARERLGEATAGFVAEVADYPYGGSR